MIFDFGGVALSLGIAGAVTAVTAKVVDEVLSFRKKSAKTDPEAIAAEVRSEREGRAAAVAEVLAAEAIAANADPERVREIIQNLMIQIAPTDPVSNPVEQLVNNYHEQALSQAKVQFWFSVVAATIGFIWILYTGIEIQADKLGTVARTFPGMVMDAVAFLFFKQASETRQRATELYDRLRSDKQLAESGAMVASIEDVRLRSAVKAQLALHMSGLKPKEIDFSAFLSSENAVNLVSLGSQVS